MGELSTRHTRERSSSMIDKSFVYDPFANCVHD